MISKLYAVWLGERTAWVSSMPRSGGIPVRYFPADWRTLGKSAGYQRNIQMAQYADALIAFWDGQSKGTKHMVETAQEFGLDVRVVFIGKGDCYGKTTKI